MPVVGHQATTQQPSSRPIDPLFQNPLECGEIFVFFKDRQALVRPIQDVIDPPTIRLETAIEKGTTSAAEKGTSRQLKREPPEAKLLSFGLIGDFRLQSNCSEGLTGARHGRFRTDPADGAGRRIVGT